MELEFTSDINITTSTVTSYCNWDMDLDKVFEAINTVDIPSKYVSDVKKIVAGKTLEYSYLSKKNKHLLKTELNDGDIFSMKYKSHIKGVNITHVYKKKTFPMSISISIVCDKMMVNIKVCKNKLQLTGIKNSSVCIKVLEYFVRMIYDVEGAIVNKPDVLKFCLHVCMINVYTSFSNINKEQIMEKILKCDNYNIFHNLTGKNNNLNIKTITDDNNQYHVYKFEDNRLHPLESVITPDAEFCIKEKKKTKKTSIMIFQTGKAIISGFNAEIIKNTIEDMKQLIEID